MAQVIDNPSIGHQIGQQFAQTIGTGLQNIAQQRTQRMQQKEMAKQFHSLGLPPELARLPENARNLILKEVLGEHGVAGYGANQGMQGGMQQPGQQGMQGVQGQRMGSAAMARQKAASAQDIARARLQDIKQARADKETLPYYKELSEAAQGARDSNFRLGRMEELNESGELDSSAWENVLGTLEAFPGVHLNLTNMRSPQSQEFKKLTADFTKDAKRYFPRLTEGEVKIFLQTIPSLSNTTEGRRRIIYNMKQLNDASILRETIAENIIEENGGERPRNIHKLVEQRARPQLDKIEKEFRKGLHDTGKYSQYSKKTQNLLTENPTIGLAQGLGMPTGLV